MPTRAVQTPSLPRRGRQIVGLAVALVVLATASCDRSTAAGPPVPSAPATSRPAATSIDRYVGGTTLLVVSVDVAAIDPPAVAAWAERAGGPDAGRQVAPRGRWRERYLAAGATHLYLVVWVEVPRARAAVVVPHAATADVAALGPLVRSAAGLLLGDRGGATLAVRPHGMAVLAGARYAVDGLVESADDPYRGRHDGLTAALARAGDGPVRAAFATSDAARAGLALVDPPLPAWLGGGRAQVLASNVDWAAANLTLPTAARPDDAALRAVVATPGEAAAGTVARALAVAVARGPGELSAAGWPDLAALVTRVRVGRGAAGLGAELSADDLAAALRAMLPRLKAAAGG